MTLLEEIKKLRELEQATPRDARYIAWYDAFREHAPVMLEVLGCFREGDAELINDILQDYHGIGDTVDTLYRMQRAASLMERS